MNLRELEVFNALMRTGTTVGAADALHLSQPAVSKILAHLEARTGVRLFERVSSRLRPTADAHTLYRHVRNLFARLETIDRITQDIKDGRNGVISVASPPTLGTSLLAEAVVRLRQLHPDVRVVFRSIRHLDVVRRVADGEADFGVIHSTTGRAGLEAEDMLPAEIVCVVAKRHPLAALPAVTLADLVPYPLVSYRPGTPIGSMIGAAFRAEGIDKAVDVQTSLSANACVLAREGTAVALTDPFPLLGPETPDLVMRRVRPALPISVQLLFSRDYPLSNIATRFLHEVRGVGAEMASRLAARLAPSSTAETPARARANAAWTRDRKPKRQARG